MRKPKSVIYVAETECCGMVIHDPTSPGNPCHGRRRGEKTPVHGAYVPCKIVRYWEYRPCKATTRAKILKKERK
jgi:hypothetical protein